MRARSLISIPALAVCLTSVALALPPTTSPSQFPSGVATIHDTAYIQSGELLMMANNRGSFGYDLSALFGKNDGLHYPGHCPTTVMYASGLWLGALVNGQVRVAVAEYAFDYTPGTILGGLPVPDDPRFRVYKIRTGDTKFTNPDYAEWPFDDGALALKNYAGSDSLDSDGDRIPLLRGDEAIWTVFNDADYSNHNSDPGSGSGGPLGVEIQLYAHAFDNTGDLGRIFYMQYTLINKSVNQLEDMHVALWADPDLGDAGDDFVGCDTTLDIGYCYNADNDDAAFGENPPTVGFGLLNGPIVPSPGGIAWQPGLGRWIAGHRNLDMTAFSKYINGTDPSVNYEAWNYMRGREIDGSVVINPANGLPTTFMMSGNPVAGTGWRDMNPADRRFMMTSGPFDMQPGDTQEVSISVMVGSTYPFDCDISMFADTVHADHTAGNSGGRAFALIASPDSTTGHDYEIAFIGPPEDIRWNLWDRTLGQLAAGDQTNFTGVGDYPYLDGMLVKVIGYTPGMGRWEVPSGIRQFTWSGMNIPVPLEGFNGAIGWNSPCHYFTVCDEPGVLANKLRRVLLRLAEVDANGDFSDSDPNVSYGYRYLRSANLPPARQEFVPFIINSSANYGFQQFSKSVPLSAWDVDASPPRRLAVGHLENNVPGGMVDGKYWPPYFALADNWAGGGPREWLWVFDVDYSEVVDPALQATAVFDNLPIMYMSFAARRFDGPWSSDDELLIIPVDSNLYFSEADVFRFTAPMPGNRGMGISDAQTNLSSIANLRLLDSVAQVKFEESYWTCACPCFADPACPGNDGGAFNVLDIVAFIDVAFRDGVAVRDRPCPNERTDVDCTGYTDVVDVVTMIDVVFRHADPQTLFCNPCNQP